MAATDVSTPRSKLIESIETLEVLVHSIALDRDDEETRKFACSSCQSVARYFRAFVSSLPEARSNDIRNEIDFYSHETEQNLILLESVLDDIVKHRADEMTRSILRRIFLNTKKFFISLSEISGRGLLI